MTYLPIALIIAGYVALVATAGWWGVGLAVAHVGALLIAAALKPAHGSQQSR